MRMPVVPLLALVLLACGPAPIGSDSSEDAEDSTSASTASEAETAEPGTDGSTDDGSGIVPDTDLPSDCDSFLQDCPEGAKCVPYASTGGNWDANKCVPVLGEQAVGEPCTYDGFFEGTDNCDATSICVPPKEVDGELVGFCNAICQGSPDAAQCPPGSFCQTCADCAVFVCIPRCDPLIQDCPPGDACFWDGGNFTCIFTTQEIPAGEPCGFINDCAAGLACLPAEFVPGCEGAACCSGFCDLELGDAPCEAQLPGTSCVAFFEAGQALPGYEQVGVCIVGG